jgi:hypothetical protein
VDAGNAAWCPYRTDSGLDRSTSGAHQARFLPQEPSISGASLRFEFRPRHQALDHGKPWDRPEGKVLEAALSRVEVR